MGLSSVALTTGNKSTVAMYRNMPDVMERAIARILLSIGKNCVKDKVAIAPNIVDIPNKKDASIAFFLLFKLANTIEEIVKPSGILCSNTAINTTNPIFSSILKLATIETPSKNV